MLAELFVVVDVTREQRCRDPCKPCRQHTDVCRLNLGPQVFTREGNGMSHSSVSQFKEDTVYTYPSVHMPLVSRPNLRYKPAPSRAVQCSSR